MCTEREPTKEEFRKMYYELRQQLAAANEDRVRWVDGYNTAHAKLGVAISDLAAANERADTAERWRDEANCVLNENLQHDATAPHDKCICRMCKTLNERDTLAARVKELEGALIQIEEYWNRDTTPETMQDACEHAASIAAAALAHTPEGTT